MKDVLKITGYFIGTLLWALLMLFGLSFGEIIYLFI